MSNEYMDISSYRNVLNIFDSVLANLRFYKAKIKLELELSAVIDASAKRGQPSQSSSGPMVGKRSYNLSPFTDVIYPLNLMELDGYAAKKLGLKSTKDAWNKLISSDVVGLVGGSLSDYGANLIIGKAKESLKKYGPGSISNKGIINKSVEKKIDSLNASGFYVYATGLVLDGQFLAELVNPNIELSRNSQGFMYYDLMSEIRTLERELNRVRIPIFQGLQGVLDEMERVSNHSNKLIAKYELFMGLKKLLPQIENKRYIIEDHIKKAGLQVAIPPKPPLPSVAPPKPSESIFKPPAAHPVRPIQVKPVFNEPIKSVITEQTKPIKTETVETTVKDPVIKSQIVEQPKVISEPVIQYVPQQVTQQSEEQKQQEKSTIEKYGIPIALVIASLIVGG